MSLCNICQFTNFNQLPAFPEHDYCFILSGFKYYHTCRKVVVQDSQDGFNGIRHHRSLSSLRTAANGGCPVCLVIKSQIDCMLSEHEKMNEQAKSLYALPTFDLWLSRRPEGGQGFWILSESTASLNMAEIIIIAAFTFTTSDDTPLAFEIRGRQLANTSYSKGMEQVVKWDNDCASNHTCYSNTGFSPPFLVAVKQTDHRQVIHVVKMASQVGVKYTALSYVPEAELSDYWEGIFAFKVGEIPIDTLPRIFRDAVYTTQILGILYLWVDRICIPEHSDTWGRNSENVASVFENAYLTISATGSKRISDGLFLSRPQRQFAEIPYRRPGVADATVIALLVALPTEVIRRDQIAMRDEPMSQDIWSFQERVLSRRILHFASNQTYFECLHHFVSEDGLLLRSRYHTTIESSRNGAESFRKRAIVDTPYARWCSILHDFGRRQAQNPNDKLLALAAIAKRYSSIMQDEYVAGHWRRSLLESLAWRTTRPGRRADVADFSVPSWSVMSIDGITDILPCEHDKLATIINLRVDLVDDTDPFGKLHGAIIEMNGPLIPAILCTPKESDNEHMFLQMKDFADSRIYFASDTLGREYKVSAEIVKRMNLFILVLKRNYRIVVGHRRCAPKSSLDCLVLTPAEGSDQVPKLRRIGFVTLLSSTLSEQNLQESRKVILLV